MDENGNFIEEYESGIVEDIEDMLWGLRDDTNDYYYSLIDRVLSCDPLAPDVPWRIAGHIFDDILAAVMSQNSLNHK